MKGIVQTQLNVLISGGTGSGLKDVDATIRACDAEPPVIAPTLDALAEAMGNAK